MQETVGDMDAASVDKADPTNANVYVGNLSAEVRAPAARPCMLLLWRRWAGVGGAPVAALSATTSLHPLCDEEHALVLLPNECACRPGWCLCSVSRCL